MNMSCLFMMVLSAVMAAANVSAAAPVELDVNAGATKYIPEVKESFRLPAVNAPAGAGQGIEIAWNPSASKYIEVVLNKPISLPEFSSATVKARFYAPAGSPVWAFGLRLQDAGGEIFQYNKRAEFKAGGIFEVKWQITPANFDACWGGRNDKVFDFPAKIYGTGIDYAPAGTEAKIYLLDIKVEVSGGVPVSSTRTLNTFDENDLFMQQWGGATLSSGSQGLTVANIGAECTLTERMYPLVFVNALPLSMELDAELCSGKNVRAQWVFRDAANQSLKSNEILLVPGKNKLNFGLSGTRGRALEKAKLPLRVEYLVLRSGQGENATVILKRSSLSLARPLIEAVDFDILTDSRIHVLRRDAGKALKFKFTNTANIPGDFTFALEMEDFYGKKFSEKFSATLQPGESRNFTPAWQPAAFGHWNINAIIREKQNPKDSFTLQRSFAYLDPSGPTPGHAPGFLFGTNSHISRWSRTDQEREIEAAGLCGAKVVRDGVEWGGIQPARGEWNFKSMDYLVNHLAEQGIEMQSLFAFTAKWAAPIEKQNSKNWLDWSRCQPNLDAWREYCRTMAGRYRGRIRYWEVWNEPDLSGFNGMTLSEYVELQKASFEEVKKVAPEACVMTGGFATMSDHPGRKDPNFHRNHLIQAKGFFDVHAYHEHGSFLQYAQLVDERFMPMRKETATTVPWYANETAIASMGGSEKNQAVTLFKKLIFSWARGAIGYSWYDMRDDGFDPHDAECSYGMMTNDFFPKPVYSVFNTIAGVYRNAQFVKQLDSGANRWIFQFKDPKGVLISAWDESAFSSTLTLAVKTDAKSVDAVDLMGNVKPQPVIEGMTMLEVNQMPYTLRLNNASTANIIGTLISVDSGAVAISGKPFAVTLKLLNPLAEDKDYKITLKTLPDGFTVAKPEAAVRVKAGSEEQASLNFKVNDSFKPAFGSVARLEVGYELSGTPWNGTLVIPVNPSISIPSGSFERKPDFELKDRTQVVSLTAADPSMSHRIWKGPEDLSAKIWLANAKGSLKMKVDVTDDIHSQPFKGFEIWKADSIQFAFQLPGQNGYWEIGLARLDNGSPEVFVFQAPAGFDPAKIASAMKLVTSRSGTETVYELDIPNNAIGFTPAIFKGGFRFNLLVNDSDGEGRDGWIHIAPGIGENKNPDKFPFVVFE